MGRGVTVSVAIATVLLAAVAGTVTPAQAYHNAAGYASTDPDVQSLLKAHNGSYYGYADEVTLNQGGTYANASKAQGIRAGLYKIRLAGKYLPPVKGLGLIGVGVTAIPLAWKVGRTIDAKWIQGDAMPSIGTGSTYGRIRDTAPQAEWEWLPADNEWRLRVFSDYGSPCGVLNVIPANFPGTLVDLFGSDRTACKEFLIDAKVWLDGFTGTVGATNSVNCPSSFFGSSYTGAPTTCYTVTATETAMQNAVAGSLKTFRDFNPATDTPTWTTTNHDPSASAQGFASDAAQAAAALAVADTEHDAGAFIAYEADPTGNPDPRIDTVTMPSCAGMTYSECIAALQALGWVGTATRVDRTRTTASLTNAANAVLGQVPATGTVIDLDDSVTLDTNPAVLPIELRQPLVNETPTAYRARMATFGWTGAGTNTLLTETTGDPAMGPSGVVQLRTPYESPRSRNWPSPAPRVWPNEDIDTYYNPDTFPPGEGGGGLPPPSDGGACTCPPPDFSPITEAELGDKFPFGVWAQFEGLLGTTLYAPADAPSWDFDFTSFSAGGFGPYDLGHYEVNLDVLDTYAAMIRTLLSWCIWIGGLWWFGARWFGFKETGDPGQAADEAWS